jgi:hypothetical protein
MLKKTTIKLAVSLFTSSVLATILSSLIILMLGGIGSHSASSSSSSSKTSGVSNSSAVSSIQSSAASASTQSKGASVSASTATGKGTKAVSVSSLYSTGGLISYSFGKFILGTLSIIITLAILYSTAWHEGTRDPNRIKFGHMKEFKLKGLVAGLLANIPMFILTTIFFISSAVTSTNAFGMVISILYRIANIQYIVFSDAFLYVPIVCYLLLLIMPVISELGYLAGRRNISLVSKLVYNNKKPVGKGKKGGSLNKR